MPNYMIVENSRIVESMLTFDSLQEAESYVETYYSTSDDVKLYKLETYWPAY